MHEINFHWPFRLAVRIDAVLTKTIRNFYIIDSVIFHAVCISGNTNKFIIEIANYMMFDLWTRRWDVRWEFPRHVRLHQSRWKKIKTIILRKFRSRSLRKLLHHSEPEFIYSTSIDHIINYNNKNIVCKRSWCCTHLY